MLIGPESSCFFSTSLRYLWMKMKLSHGRILSAVASSGSLEDRCCQIYAWSKRHARMQCRLRWVLARSRGLPFPLPAGQYPTEPTMAPWSRTIRSRVDRALASNRGDTGSHLCQLSGVTRSAKSRVVSTNCPWLWTVCLKGAKEGGMERLAHHTLGQVGLWDLKYVGNSLASCRGQRTRRFPSPTKLRPQSDRLQNCNYMEIIRLLSLCWMHKQSGFDS